MGENKVSKIRNPSPQDIKDIVEKYETEAVSATPTMDANASVPTTEPENVPTFSDPNFAIVTDSKLKPESKYSPKRFPHKLIFPREYYEDQNIDNDNTISIRRFSAIEEGFFYEALSKIKSTDNNFEEIFKITNKALNNCIRTNIHINKLNVLDKMNLLAHVIALTYGQVFPFEANCKGCGRLDANIDLYDLDVCYIHDTSIVMKKIHLDSYEDEDITVTLCPPRISNEENFFNAYNKISLNKSMIVGAINGDTLVDESELDDMVTYLNSDDAKKFDDYYNFINSTFGIKLNNIPFKCQNKQCLHKNQIQHTDFTLENFILRILQ